MLLEHITKILTSASVKNNEEEIMMNKAHHIGQDFVKYSIIRIIKSVELILCFSK